MPRSILIVDDDTSVRDSVARSVGGGGARVAVADSATRALAGLAEVKPDLVVSDVRMPEMDGLEFLRLLKDRAPDVDVVLMTAYDDLPTVVAAMRAGAADFLVKPLDLHQLRLLVDRIFEDRATRRSVRGEEQREEAPPGPDALTGGVLDRLVGRDRRMVEIFKVIGQMARDRTTVLIRGESGTGKELIARAIHEGSDAAQEPFVAVNCAAVPETLLESELFGHRKGAFTGATSDRQGRFAAAGRGTIFLDEIGDTTPSFQAKLLRVLQEREFYPVGGEQPLRTEARVLAATHQDLEARVEEGAFREDLYYRLRVVEIVVPPLRERPGDVPLLADHLLRRGAERTGRRAPVLSDESVVALAAHSWPGNVRELQNCLTRAAALATGGVVRPEHLALSTLEGGAPMRLESLEEMEARHVARVLEATGGNRTRTAEILGISRPRLLRMIARYRLEPE